MKKGKKIILRILTIIFAAFLIFGIAHIIYVQYHRGEAVEYLVEKYNTSAQDYKIKKYYPRKLVNNSSHSSNLFEFYFTNETWNIIYNERSFQVQKIGDKIYDNYQLEDISKYAAIYLKENIDKNILGMEISTELLYDSTLKNLPTNTNKLITETSIEKLILNKDSDYSRTITIYYLTNNCDYYRNSAGNGNKNYKELKNELQSKLLSKNANVKINLVIFEKEMEFERFTVKKQKGIFYQSYGIDYATIEKEKGKAIG